MLVQKQIPRLILESDLECSLFSTYFVHKHDWPEIVFSPVSVLAMMHPCAVWFESLYSVWVVFNADGSLEK